MLIQCFGASVTEEVQRNELNVIPVVDSVKYTKTRRVLPSA